MAKSVLSKKQFSELDEKQLNRLIADAKKELESRKKTKIRALKKQLQGIASELDTSVESLLGIKGGSTAKAPAKKKRGAPRGKVPPKYRNPNKASETWTGRGRQPKWVEAFLAGGGKLDDISI